MNKLNEVLSSKLPELMKESGVSRRDWPSVVVFLITPCDAGRLALKRQGQIWL